MGRAGGAIAHPPVLLNFRKSCQKIQNLRQKTHICVNFRGKIEILSAVIISSFANLQCVGKLQLSVPPTFLKPRTPLLELDSV